MTDSQKSILEEIKKKPSITQNELSNIVGINLRNIKNNMKKLQDLALLKREGTDKVGEWIIIEK